MEVSFKGVTPVIGKPGTIKTLSEELKNSAGLASYELQNATSLYREGSPFILNPQGIFAKSVREEGKEIGFLVTGPEYEKWAWMEQGWGGEAAPSRHIDNPIVQVGENIAEAVKILLEKILSGK